MSIQMAYDMVYVVVNGVLAVIAVSLSIVIAAKFFLAYNEHKRKELFLIAFVAILMSEAWMPVAISFIYYMFTYTLLPAHAYFFIGYTFLPVGIFIWLIIFTNLIIKNRQKVILLLYAFYIVFYEILLFLFLLTDPSQIGEIKSPVDSSLTLIFNLNAFGWVAVILTTGIIFARESLQSSDPIIRLKGKLLLFGFITWSVAAIFDGFANTIITLFIVRVVLMASVIALYGGFILPEWMRKLVNKMRSILNLEPIEK